MRRESNNYVKITFINGERKVIELNLYSIINKTVYFTLTYSIRKLKHLFKLCNTKKLLRMLKANSENF